MQDNALTSVGGEFRDATREASFQAERQDETRRHLCLSFIIAAILNAVCLISDWRFHGTSHFYIAISGRLAVVAVSLLCFAAIFQPRDFRRLQHLMIVWNVVTAIGVGLLVSARTDIALFVMMMLPSIMYLVIPTAFRWSVISGVGCSAAMLAGYLAPDPHEPTTLGLVLVMVMLNFALVLIVSRSNRLRRLEWAATMSEREAKEALAESRKLFERMFMAVPIPLVINALDSGRLIGANDAAYSYFGVTAEIVESDAVKQIIDPAARSHIFHELQQQHRAEPFESNVRLCDGTMRDVLLAATALDVGGTRTVMSGVVDITDRKLAEHNVQYAATHDGLTGLPNRAFFQVHLSDTLIAAEQAGGSGVSILLVDIDEFKEINDTLGHDAGDALLIQIGARLRSVMPGNAFIARLGGDEFVVLLSGRLELGDVARLAGCLLDELKKPIFYRDLMMTIRGSIGVAAFPHHHRDPIELMKDADLALYAAKGAGRGRVALYDPQMRLDLERKVAVGREVEAGLLSGQFIPYYQPRIDLRTGKVVGFEALARWQHPLLGLQTPAYFMSAFEHAELAVALGDAMVRSVARDMREWLDQGLDFGRVAINFSPVEFRDENLATRILDIMRAAGVPPNRVGVEVTETVFLARNSGHVATILRQFRSQNVNVALDDFGTGYASLSHLKQFPIDEIKIDCSFVRDVEIDEDDASIVGAVIDLGRNLRMDVVAEGVESEGQLRFLRAHGCGQGQGFLFAKPMAASRVPNFLRAGIPAALFDGPTVITRKA